MVDQFVTTETIVREWDANGKLVREVSTLIQTRTPDGAGGMLFGFQPPTQGVEPDRVAEGETVRREIEE